MTYDSSLLKWKHPFTCICAGPSCCGKTTFVLKFLENLPALVEGDIRKVIWFCSEGSEPSLNGVEIRNEVPSFKHHDGTPSLFIIDDLMHDTFTKEVSELFTRGSHHFNISIILITQNMFFQNPQSRNISLNSKYIIVFRNPRDRSQFGYLARQVYPEKSKELERVYKEATSKAYSYLVLDLSQETPDSLRFRTNIFPGELNIVYAPKKKNEENQGK